ncbi:hypothetical protein ES319_D07G198600v1 [Gossypium barbadense]|uniref:Putative plant transposon protein domain-containing protein n=2 Tax=Gossypium TaxID=3633 RepID=A0A5J5QVS1_GOSBA|nr:hypothetical protein ES319_D07G198600v1 [Gossypium barbadense]TYG62255.1 hypothetical protein ES288_D07G214100v1 [Gossypium darwinii]
MRVNSQHQVKIGKPSEDVHITGKFVTLPVVPSVVHEFYANLKFFEEDKVYVRGREVEISSSIISKYYRVLFLANNEIELLDTRNFKGVNVDYIMLYLTEDKIWLHFLRMKVCPTSSSRIVNPFQAILLTAILQRKQISIGTWIYKFMLRCVIRDDTGIFFPHLITDLCRAARVPIDPLKPFRQPTTHMITSSIYQKFKAIQQEQRT